MTPTKVRSLTSFRFITAFCVFLFHCQMYLGWKTRFSIVNEFIENGAIFMTGFFTLSGFIVAYVYSEVDFTKRANIFAFYFKRFAKIYPTYAVVTIVYFSIFHNFSIQNYLRITVNDLLLVQGFFPSMFQIGINGGTWSLTVECFLYFLLPFILLLANKSEKILIVGGILGVITSFNITFETTDIIYSNPIFRIPDFLCGIGFYFLCKRIRFNHFIHLVAVSLLFLACLFLGSSRYQYIQGHFIVPILFGAWIASVFHSDSKLYNNKVLEYLGMISYSFYLWQFAAIDFGQWLIKIFPAVNLYIVVLIVFSVNTIVAAISYHCIEERARKFLLRKFTN
jgi:peptidoglycan/LPS O-acetylase OafA/YrhL